MQTYYIFVHNVLEKQPFFIKILAITYGKYGNVLLNADVCGRGR